VVLPYFSLINLGALSPMADKKQAEAKETTKKSTPLPKEIGGQEGPEPTRYGDWEKNGRCTDF
jgi:hypothetical protein